MKTKTQIAIEAISAIVLICVSAILLSFVAGLVTKAIVIFFKFGYGLI